MLNENPVMTRSAKRITHLGTVRFVKNRNFMVLGLKGSYAVLRIPELNASKKGEKTNSWQLLSASMKSLASGRKLERGPL